MSILWQIRSILRKNNQAAESQKTATNTTTESAGTVERRNRKRLNTHKGRRVLIVDDSPTVLAALKKILRSAGCITLEAADAEKGLELAKHEKPDLIFLDIVLPGMNGFAALRLMRRDPVTQHIPVIMISGNEQATEQFYAKRIGADDFMKKPFLRHEVFARIENLVDANKLERLKVPDSTFKSTSRIGPASFMPALSQTPSIPAAPTALSNDNHVAQGIPKSSAPAEPGKPRLTALEARAQLTAMGLQYFNQEQFLSAIERGDALAIELFMVGGGISTDD